MPWQTDIDRPPSHLVHGGSPSGPECIGCHGCIGQPGFAGPQPTLQSLRGAGCMCGAPSSRAQSSRMPSSRASSCPPPMTPHLKLPTFRATKPPRALPAACLPLETFLRPATEYQQSRAGVDYVGTSSFVKCGQHEAANAGQRKFEIVDPKGYRRYHCKPCHMYLPATLFDRHNVTYKIHMCKLCDDAVKSGGQPGKHAQPRTLTVPWAGARTSKRQELGGGHRELNNGPQLHQSGSFDRRYNTRHCFRRKENGTFYVDPAPDDKMSSCLMSPPIRSTERVFIKTGRPIVCRESRTGQAGNLTIPRAGQADPRKSNQLHDEIGQLKQTHKTLMKQHSTFCLAVDGPKLRQRGKLEVQLNDVEKIISLKNHQLQVMTC